MKVTRLPDADPRPRRVAVGTFDGVHRGHREVIGGADTVITFDPHPLSVLAPARAPLLLTTLERKAELVASLGVDELVVVPFDQAFAALTAEEFVDVVLVQRMAATHVSVGENFRFGRGAEGDAARLAADGRFETRVAPLLEVDAEVVSSSHIRGLVLGGAVGYAGELLGAPFSLTREVVHGDKRGRELGFPTANLLPADGYVTPGHGVYACRATVASGGDVRGGHEHRCAADVRDRPGRADRGVPARLLGRHLRPAAAPGVPQAAARREAFRVDRRARRADGPGRRRGPGDRGLTLLPCAAA